MLLFDNSFFLHSGWQQKDLHIKKLTAYDENAETEVNGRKKVYKLQEYRIYSSHQYSGAQRRGNVCVRL